MRLKHKQFYKYDSLLSRFLNQCFELTFESGMHIVVMVIDIAVVAVIARSRVHRRKNAAQSSNAAHAL